MRWLSSLKLAFRSLLRTPGFTVTAVLTLALGLGATTSIYSVVNGAQLNLLPWGDTDTLVSIDVHRPKHDPEPRDSSEGQYQDFERECRAYSGLLGITWESAYLTDRDERLLVTAPRVTPTAFEIVRVAPLRGRAFDAHDGKPGAAPVAMISERLWTERYAAAPELIGGKIAIDGEPTTIIGVIASARWFPTPNAAIVRPLILSSAAPSRADERIGVVGRLAPGKSVAQAQAEIELLAERLAQRYPATDADLALTAQLTRDTILGPQARAGNVFLLCAAGLLLLIVCANLAGLLLARAVTRRKEIATRAALGASRAQIVGYLLCEAAAIALLALPLSLLVVRGCLDYMLSLVPKNIVYMDQIFRIDQNVLAFGALVAASTILLFGLMPALKATRFDLATELKSGGERGSTQGGSQRMRSLMVVVQIALSVSLLATAALFMRGFARNSVVDPGFDTAGVIVAQVVLPEARYREPDQMRAFHRRLSDTLQQLPGGSRAALTSDAPLGWDGPWREFQIEGRETSSAEQAPRARWTSASPQYFSTLGLRTRAGRDLTEADNAGAQPVVVVTQSFANKFFPGESPVGRRIRLGRASGAGEFAIGTREIVGVVSDVKSFPGLDAPSDQPRIYEPIAQQPTRSFEVLVRTREGEGPLAGVLRQRVRALDPLLGVTNIETMDARFDRRVWQSRFFVRVMLILGALALALAAIGVHGVVAYTTARRTREFGIRAALGAEPRQIAGLVLRKTATLAAWGGAVGVCLAWLWGKASQKMLYDTPAQDPILLGVVLSVLTVVLLVASALPVLRALRIQPADCLRTE